MKMGIEIERKFLLPRDYAVFDINNPTKIEWKEIQQGYLSKFDDVIVRIRLSKDGHFPVPLSTGYITIKYKTSDFDLATNEFEYVVDEKDAQQMLDVCKSALIKTRFIKRIDGVRWEIDYFKGLHTGLIVGEVEFVSEDVANSYEIPNFVLKEVTNDKRFSNAWLANATNSEIKALIAEVYSD